MHNVTANTRARLECHGPNSYALHLRGKDIRPGGPLMMAADGPTAQSIAAKISVRVAIARAQALNGGPATWADVARMTREELDSRLGSYVPAGYLFEVPS